MTEAVTVLVTGAGGSAAANVIDALRSGRRDYWIVGVDASSTKLHLSAADVQAVVPLAGDPHFPDALAALVDEHLVDVVHPQPDPDVLAVARLRPGIAASTCLPSTDVLLLAGDKLRSACLLAEAGVPVPESRPITSADQAGQVVEDLLERHERVWVRARRGAGSRAALPVRKPEHALAWIAYWVDEKGMPLSDFMACEMLPGREFAYQSVWQEGRLVAGQTRERLEYLYGFLSPSGQSSTPAVARTVCDERVDHLAQAAILAVDPMPHGAYCVDIKESADGRPKVTEINAGRFFTTCNFFARAGLNMPEMLVESALGIRQTPRGSSPLPADLYWIRMVDMGYVLVSGEELDRFPRPRL